MPKSEKVFKPDKRLRVKYAFGGIFFSTIGIGIIFGFVAITYFMMRSMPPQSPFTKEIFMIVVYVSIGLLAFCIILSIITSILAYNAIEYEITSKSVIVRRGIISKQSTTIPFKKITNIDVRRGVFDRMLGISTIMIHTAGYGGTMLPEERLQGLRDHQKVYNDIMKKID